MLRLLVVLLALGFAADAHAATVTYEAAPPQDPRDHGPGGVSWVHVKAAPGEINVIDLSRDGSFPVVRDAGAPLVAGAGCQARVDGSVQCPGGTFMVDAGDGDDRVVVRADASVDGRNQLDGGAGNDVVAGRGGGDKVFGNEGVDRVDGGAGDDNPIGEQVDGGSGDDWLAFDGLNPRGTSVRCGEGDDTVVFPADRTPVRPDCEHVIPVAGPERIDVDVDVDRPHLGRRALRLTLRRDKDSTACRTRIAVIAGGAALGNRDTRLSARRRRVTVPLRRPARDVQVVLRSVRGCDRGHPITLKSGFRLRQV